MTTIAMARPTEATYGEPGSYEHSTAVSSDKNLVTVPSFAVYSSQTQVRNIVVAVAGYSKKATCSSEWGEME
jgi:hypothetical protein